MQTVPIGAGGAIPQPLFCPPRRQVRLLVLAGAVTTCFVAPAWGDSPPPEVKAKIVHASWYGHEFARRLTASGTPFDPYKMTGAHRTWPLGTRVRVTNLHNGRSVLVTINDRGPYRDPARREIDLSYGAARVLGMVRRGIARVRIEPVES